MTYINISGYKFIELTELEQFKSTLHQLCLELDLKGTILLSLEGINVFVSGVRDSIDAFYQRFGAMMTGIDFKESPSTEQPFKHMRVKIKKEIITFGVPNLSPSKNPAPYVSAQTFKAWLDDNKDMIVLDTRNDYEVSIGKFKNAVDLDIKNFTSFAQAIAQLPESYKSIPIVTYCTGGVRCEKAAPFLMQQGFQEVYQLDGGILKYLEVCGHEHYEGECFVFDKRMAVDAELKETHTVQCHVCRHPVTDLQQQTNLYRMGESCPNCYNSHNGL